MIKKIVSYTIEELTEALRAINSIIHKCEKAQEKFPEGNLHHTLLCNRLKSMYISKSLIIDSLAKIESIPESSLPQNKEGNVKELLSHLNLLHTTDLGAQRIRKNMNLNISDVIGWCRGQVITPDAIITQKGNNWYITVACCEITVNAHSYTIITAHPISSKSLSV